MNRRQKMKRMKQELEWYKKQMVPTREVGYDSRQMRVETLKAEECVVEKYLTTALPSEQYIHDKLNNKLLKELLNYITYDRREKPRFGPLPAEFVYTAEIKVVVPHGGDKI